jgi:hypothetical protein
MPVDGLGEAEFMSEVFWVPEAGEAMQHCAIWG